MTDAERKALESEARELHRIWIAQRRSRCEDDRVEAKCASYYERYIKRLIEQVETGAQKAESA